MKGFIFGKVTSVEHSIETNDTKNYSILQIFSQN